MICLEQYAAGLRESGHYQGLPVCGLMETEGERYLLANFPIPEGVWLKAVASGAQGVMWDGPLHSIEAVEALQRRDGFIQEPAIAALLAPTVRTRPFVHLHAHSQYSALDGYAKIQEMLDAIRADGQDTMALTDHGVCAGHLELQKLCKVEGVKPVFGLEAYFVDNALIKDAATRYDYWHLILLAKTEQGLINLWRASTMAHATDRQYIYPRMDWEVLKACHEGLIVSTACLRGPLSRMILNDDEDGAKLKLSRLQEIFRDDTYLELGTNHVHKQQKKKGAPGEFELVSQIKLNRGLVSLSKDMSVPLIVVGDSHYACEEDKEAHKVWIKAQTDSDLQDEDELFSGDEDYHLHSGEQAYKAIDYLGDDVAAAAVAMTVELAAQCDVTIRPRTATPIYHRHQIAGSDVQGMELDNDKMRRVCEESWTTRLQPEHHDDPVYKARFEEEYESLVSKSFAGYMLIVWDYCLDPSTPVLTEDLRWVEVGKLEAGDRLAGFDEDKVLKNKKAHRYWRSTEVVNTRRVVLPTYKVVLDDGTETVASEDHQWLISSPNGGSIRWARTKDLSVGQRPQRLMSEWDEPDTWEAGYIAGILDGEGFLSLTPLYNGGRSLYVGFAQKEGTVLDTALRILDSWGFDYSVRDHGPVRNGLRSVGIRGGRSEVMRLLGMARPQRLLPKLHLDLLGRLESIEKPAIISVEPLGLGEVVALETTTGTLVAQGFAHHNCNYARSKKILMGPGRGSAAGSLVCDLMGITQIDPIEAGLLYERFISPGRTELPDIDSDFPASKRFVMINYIVERWGHDHAVRVGTVTRLRNLGAFREVAKVFKGSDREVPYVVVEEVCKKIKQAEHGTAGFGLSWDDLFDAIGDELEPFREQYPDWFRFAGLLVGRIKSYGKHPAGVVIDPMNSIVDWLPLRQGDEDYPVTEFPMDQIAELGLVKFDILTVRTLDTVQEVMDLLEADERYTGKIPHPHTWRQEYEDPLVWDMLCAGDTLGVFQVETPDGTRQTKQFQPRSVADMSAIGALVRPGPKRSGITDAYIRRRSGQEPVSYAHPLLETVLNETFGLMIYQENVMKATQVIAGYSSAEADEVRSILGKKKVDKIAAEGERFRARSANMGVDEGIASRMFEQMAEFAKYAFNKSHSWSYAMVSVWTAWFKANFPAHFLVALLSTADKDRFPAYVSEARRRGYRIDLPDVNDSAETFKVSEDNLGVRYGLSSIKKLGPVAAQSIRFGQPYSSFDDFLKRRGDKCNWGHVKLLAEVGALDALIPEGHNRVDLQAVVEQMSTGKIEQCAHLLPDAQPSMGREVCCNFDWSSEPVMIGVSGKPLKGKPLPKACSKACRQYHPVSSIHWPHLEALTPREQRQLEREAFGLYISSTPFDNLNLDDTGPASIEEMQGDASYVVVAEVQAVREREDKFKRRMAYLTLTLIDGEIDTACFSSVWADLRRDVKKDSFGMFVVKKNSRGFTLNRFIPLKQE